MGNLEQDAIRRILAGDRDAFRVLMDRHLPTVLRMTYRVTRNAVDAEEAAQEAFLLAYKKLSSFREQSAFGTWVYRIAMNCSLNLVERRSRDLAWGAVTIEPGSPSENIAVSRGLTPEAALLQNEALRRRERAMLTLTPMERTAFILRHMEEQPIQVIADALGVQHNSAKQAIFRAVAKLRRELAPTARAAASSVSAPSLTPSPTKDSQ
jgi:RNA polymerase sigma-70 factor (ECF subfamily)